jgi:hypothetical protein
VTLVSGLERKAVEHRQHVGSVLLGRVSWRSRTRDSSEQPSASVTTDRPLTSYVGYVRAGLAGRPNEFGEDIMDAVAPPTSRAATPLSPGRFVLRASTVCVLAAVVVNVGIYGLGWSLTDASLVVSPALGPQDFEVDALKVALTTLAYFAPGVVLLALAARRSLRWVRILAVVAGVYAVVSAWGPLDAAHDRATGWILIPMHWTTGAAFVIATLWVHRRLAESKHRRTL